MWHFYWLQFKDWVRSLWPWDQRKAPAALVYRDEFGQGWTRFPDYQEAWSADTGQHDAFKRLLHEAVRRAQGNPPEPVQIDLAAASRRLGFVYLAESIGMSREEALLFWSGHEAGVSEACKAQATRAELTRTELIGILPGFIAEPADFLIALRTLGPFDGAALPEGKERAVLKRWFRQHE